MIVVKYVISGGLALLTHLTVLVVLVEALYIDTVIATCVGFVAAVGVNYTLQYHWCFQGNSSHSKVFTKYVVLTSIMYIVNILFFYLLEMNSDLHYLIIQIIVTAVIFTTNFMFGRFIIFR
jgi:putative flippase GtrA